MAKVARLVGLLAVAFAPKSQKLNQMAQKPCPFVQKQLSVQYKSKSISPPTFTSFWGNKLPTYHWL
jgi:hypothetical protein